MYQSFANTQLRSSKLLLTCAIVGCVAMLAINGYVLAPRPWHLGLREQSMTQHYGMMLFAQSLMMLLIKWDQGLLPDLPLTFLKIDYFLRSSVTQSIRYRSKMTTGPGVTALARLRHMRLSLFPLQHRFLSWIA